MAALVDRARSGIVVVSGDRAPTRTSDDLGVAAQPAPRKRQVGTGIILDVNGHVLTTMSVVRSAQTFRVTHAEKDYPASLITTDPVSGLALLYAEGVKGIEPLPLADTSSIRAGSWTLIVGAGPVGPVQSSFGLVTRVPSVDDDADNHLLATTATLGPGASGGAVLNTRGEIVGIATAAIMVRTTGLAGEEPSTIGAGDQRQTMMSGGSIAIPVDVVREVADIVRARGTIVRSYLGVRWVGDDAPIASTDVAGVAVWDVVSGSPAERLGLQKGDIVTAFNGVPVASGPSLRALVQGAAPGEVIRLTLQRGGQPLTLAVPLDTLRVEARASPR